MQAVIIILLVVAVLLVIFTLQNSTEISISLFFWEIPNAPLVLVIMSCIVLGYIVSSIYFYPKIWKLKKENTRLNKFNQELNQFGMRQPQEDIADDIIANNEDPEGIELEDVDDNSFFKE
jgi:uncharacterized integral membrane protein